ncbi:MAG: hypothetical protein ABI782_07005 [Anaerolineaceae bacterium]
MSSSVRGKTARRNNAPIRPRKPATSVPDLIFTVAFTGWTMAVIFLASSFFDDDVTAGEAGQVLARLFAGALALTSALGFVLGLLLLRDQRGQRDHYVVPALLGITIGVLEAFLFLWAAAALLFAPFLLLIFAFRGVRRTISRSLTKRSGARR